MDDHTLVCFSNFDSDNLDDHKAVLNAIKANPRNAVIAPPLQEGDGGSVSGRPKLAMFTGKLWRPGHQLKIAFMSGTEWQRNKVKQYAPVWTQYANLKFTFINHGSATPDILIDFNPGNGNWSKLAPIVPMRVP